MRHAALAVLVASAVGCTSADDPLVSTTDAGTTGGPKATPTPVDGGGIRADVKPGQTEFVTEEQGGGVGRMSVGGLAPTVAGAPAPAADNAKAAEAAPGAPMGRVGDVEEGDIYKIVGNKVYYFNTYRGFVVYDVNDPKAPKRLGRLPVFGYPIEMFVEGNTVFALLKDALYLTQVDGKLQFEKHNVSQLVSIDVTDPTNPRLLKTIDILGQLREGVSRKIENTIYVVSYIAPGYYWGWRNPGMPQQPQAFVYSFNVAKPTDPQLVEKLQIFEGGNINVRDPSGSSYSRNFREVRISATSNALMVVENWDFWAYAAGGARRCGFSDSGQQAIVSIIDISDPKGDIRLHSRFETAGQLTDQFKQTYVFDEATKKATYFGIFAKQGWSSANCMGTSYIQNTIESWDVTDGKNPKTQSLLNFGKKNENVRGTAFDVKRNVAYAITAQRIDPLYAISIADPKNLKILSEVNDLSGDMTVFRLVAGGGYLLAIGNDNSNACTGTQDTMGFRPTKVAVSVIDVRDLNKMRLSQRQCVNIKGADWIGSAAVQDMDQGHKMIGMHSDKDLNIITVPVHYARRTDENSWWYYRYETAVGMMAWDVSKDDPTKPAAAQNVLQNFGTFIHPHGEVKRSIVFTHQGVTPRRMMINLSDTHISIANLEDMNNPKLESEIELAPYYNQIYKFGDYVLQYLQPKPGNWSEGVSEFRVKAAGGDLEDKPVLATFSAGQVERVVKQGNYLILFRREQTAVAKPAPGQPQVYVPPQTEIVVYDLTDPAKPKAAGRLKTPYVWVPYYRFWCGGAGYFGAYWFDGFSGDSWTGTDDGLVFLRTEYTQNQPVTRLVFLDLRNPAMPTLKDTVLPQDRENNAGGLVGDPVDPKGFFMNYRSRIGEVKTGDYTFTRYRWFAQKWQTTGGTLSPGDAINVPGRVTRTWSAGSDRMFLTQDASYRVVTLPNGTNGTYNSLVTDTRLNLLRQTAIGGKAAAELLDARVFPNTYLAGLIVTGDRLVMNARLQNYYATPVGISRAGVAADVASPSVQPGWDVTSDRIMIFDLTAKSLVPVYDQPTRMYNVTLMGTHQGRVFLNLPGDGVLVVDVSDAGRPVGTRFLRTLGYASHIEFVGNTAYVAAGYFGIYNLPLDAPTDIPNE